MVSGFKVHWLLKNKGRHLFSTIATHGKSIDKCLILGDVSYKKCLLKI